MKNELNITLIAAGAAINGDMIIDHGVSCFGLCNASVISTNGLLHIGEGGMVKGSLQGEHVRLDGRVDGNVHARGSLEINGHVSGDIFYCGTIRLGPHASLNGSIKRVPREKTIEAQPVATQIGAPETNPGEGTGPGNSAAAKVESNVTELPRAAVH
jgi:cytoskeletal protein CcmA (bactofilin family)